MKSYSQIIKEAEDHVRAILDKEGTGHDWYHIERVRTMALRIAKTEPCNIEVVELSALLHELPDRKIAGEGNEKKALLNIRSWLENQEIPSHTTEEILYIIDNQSFSKSGLTPTKLDSIEAKIVQDADRLDGLGAIGIARCFAYGGKQGRPIENISKEEYINYQGTSLNHFYEKLLKLKDLMNTKTAKQIAQERHKFLETFLEQFLEEWGK